MSAALISVVLILLAEHFSPGLQRLRRVDGFLRWLDWLSVQGSGSRFMESRYAVLVSIGLPVLLVGLLQALLATPVYGLLGFLFALLVLFWSWGPRDLDQDVEAVVDADTGADRQRVLADLHPLAPSTALSPGAGLVPLVFRAALERWFGVLFWFLLLGPAGAVLYRLTCVAAAPREELASEHLASLLRLKLILQWPAAQLMTLALAIGAHFDAVFVAWRDWHAARGQGYWVLDLGFLDAAARASVRVDLAEQAEQAEASLDEAAAPSDEPLADDDRNRELQDAMSLVWRVLLVWLFVMALMVLAGFVG